MPLTRDQFNQQVQITPPQNTVTFTASDLQALFNLPYVPVQPKIAWMDTVVGNLHLRSTPYIDQNNPKANIIESMADGTIVGVLDGGIAIVASGFDWLHVQSPTGRTGYAAKVVNGQATLVPRGNPTTPRKLIGVHCLQDADNISKQFYAQLPAGTILPSATVVNNPTLAAWWCDRAKYVIVRNTNTEHTIPLIPDDTSAAIIVGQNWIDANKAWILAYDQRVYVQVEDELKFTPGHDGFWRGVLSALDAIGRKGVIGAYAVGQPEPPEWAQMTIALQYAMARGHIVALHSYCQLGTAPGNLSTDGVDYEFRHVKLYNAVPSDARPDLVITEDGHEFTAGLFEGAQSLVAYSDKLQQNDQQYPWLQSRNKWTLGTLGWDKSSIDSAVGALAAFISTGRYP